MLNLSPVCALSAQLVVQPDPQPAEEEHLPGTQSQPSPPLSCLDSSSCLGLRLAQLAPEALLCLLYRCSGRLVRLCQPCLSLLQQPCTLSSPARLVGVAALCPLSALSIQPGSCARWVRFVVEGISWVAFPAAVPAVQSPLAVKAPPLKVSYPPPAPSHPTHPSPRPTAAACEPTPPPPGTAAW